MSKGRGERRPFVDGEVGPNGGEAVESDPDEEVGELKESVVVKKGRVEEL